MTKWAYTDSNTVPYSITRHTRWQGVFCHTRWQTLLFLSFERALNSSSVNASWYLRAWGSPYVLQLIAQKFPKCCNSSMLVWLMMCCLWKHFPFWHGSHGYANGLMAVSDPFKEHHQVLHFLFLYLSPPGSQWCDVLCFVPTGSVSSSSTLESL